MSELPILEEAIFSGVLILYLGAAILGVRQLSSGEDKYGRLLAALIALAVSLECVILIFRAAAIHAFPITGLFESMIVLTVVFGLTFLLLSVVIRQGTKYRETPGHEHILFKGVSCAVDFRPGKWGRLGYGEIGCSWGKRH